MSSVNIIKDFRGDIRSVIRMSKAFHSEAQEKGPWNETLVASFLSQVCEHPNACMLVAVDAFARRCGFLVARAAQNYLTGELMAEETAIYVDPMHRKLGVGDDLLDAFEIWSKEEMNATRMRVTAQASLRMAGVVRWFESRGYEKAEMSLTKEVHY